MTIFHSNAHINLATISGLDWSTGEDKMGSTSKHYRTDVGDCEFQCKVTAIGDKVDGKFKVDVYVNNTTKSWDDDSNMHDMASDDAITDSSSQHILKHLYNTHGSEGDGVFDILPNAFTKGSIETFAATLKTNIESSVSTILGGIDGTGGQTLIGSVWGRLDIDNDNDISWYTDEASIGGAGDGDGAMSGEGQELVLELAKAYSIQDDGAGGSTTSLGTNINASFGDSLNTKDGTNHFLDGHKMTVNLTVNANINVDAVIPVSYSDVVIAFV